MDIGEIVCDVEQILLTHCRSRWLTVVNLTKNFVLH